MMTTQTEGSGPAFVELQSDAGAAPPPTFDLEKLFLDAPDLTVAVRAALKRIPETNMVFSDSAVRNLRGRGVWGSISAVNQKDTRASAMDTFAHTLIHYLGAQYGVPATNAKVIPLNLIKFMRSGAMTSDELSDPEFKPWCSFFVRYKGNKLAIFASQPYDADQLDIAGLCREAGVSSVITIHWRRIFEAAVMASVERWEFLQKEKGERR